MTTKICPYCLSDIPEKAMKCKYCQEWQEVEDATVKLPLREEFQPFTERYPEANVPFQLKLVRWLPVNYVVGVLILTVLLFGAIQVYWYYIEEDRIFLLTFLTYSIQMLVSWAGLIWAYTLINRNYSSFIQISLLPQTDSEAIYLKYHNLMFNKRLAVLAGIVTGTTASLGEYVLGTPFLTDQAKIVFAVFEFINMFFAGAAIYTVLIFSIFLFIISKMPNKLAVGMDKNNGVLNIGHVHIRTSVLAIVPLFLGVVARLFGKWAWEPLHILWYSAFALIIILYFFWPLNNIHKIMSDYRDEQLHVIHKKIQNILFEISRNPDSSNFSKLNEYKMIENTISNQNTWPFDTKSISFATIAVIFPVVLMIVEKLWSF
ncbi:MAG: hypothetical protein IH591_20010 [Bacteroidales bacterium]|nr:hypothetical protein [Bacteroidales bacterium]